MKRILLITFILISFSSLAEIDQLDIENHPQTSFPSLTLIVQNKSIGYYGLDSALDGDLKFAKQTTELKGEIPLSGYIFAKEFVDSFRIPNTLGNKKTKSEFLKIFAENNPGKLVDYILSIDEKKRTAENEEELKKIQQLIKKFKTDDDPETTAIFSTGFIEIKSPLGNSERYFIKTSDLDKKNVKLNADKTKINLLKSITIYSFQNILSSLNFGDIEKDSPEDNLYNQLEKINLSVCHFDCPSNPTLNLSQLALNVGMIVNFEVVGNSKIENIDDFNKYVLAQQWCVLKNFSNACHEKELDEELAKLGQHPIILELITRHKNTEGLCSFFQKK